MALRPTYNAQSVWACGDSLCVGCVNPQWVERCCLRHSKNTYESNQGPCLQTGMQTCGSHTVPRSTMWPCLSSSTQRWWGSGGGVAMVPLQTGKKDSIFSNCTHEEHRTADWVETETPLRNKSTREFCCLRKIFLNSCTVGLFSPNETLCKTLPLIERNMNAEP